MSKIIICPNCSEEKLLYAKGLCKKCYQHNWYIKNQGEQIERARNYGARNQEKIREQKRNRHIENPNIRPNQALRSKYGITLAEYNEILESQGGVCWICGKSPKKNRKRLAVDHNHKTGRIRGLLCETCNRAIGLFEDNPSLLTRAIEYLSVFEDLF